jgi:hypothetical protein
MNWVRDLSDAIRAMKLARMDWLGAHPAKIVARVPDNRPGPSD